MRPDVDDAYLVARAQDGYFDAFEMLVARHAAGAYRIALRVTGHHHTAQDVTQEAFIAAWRALARFRGDAAFGTWLYTIVVRHATNAITRHRTERATDLLAEVPDRPAPPHSALDDDDVVDAVTAAVAALPLPQRVAVVLHHFEGLSYAEVATVTGSSVAAIRNHLFRARRALASSLQDWR